MECLLQYLDDLDDLYGMVGLVAERLRRVALTIICIACLGAAMLVGGWLAFVHPPVGMAVSYLLAVTLLYRSATGPRQPQSI